MTLLRGWTFALKVGSILYVLRRVFQISLSVFDLFVQIFELNLFIFRSLQCVGLFNLSFRKAYLIELRGSALLSEIFLIIGWLLLELFWQDRGFAKLWILHRYVGQKGMLIN
jgi:hypothetical protein